MRQRTGEQIPQYIKALPSYVIEGFSERRLGLLILEDISMMAFEAIS